MRSQGSARAGRSHVNSFQFLTETTMTLSRLLAAAFSILALAGCGTTESSAPAGGTPPAETADSKPATEAAPPASDEALQSPPVSDKAEV